MRNDERMGRKEGRMSKTSDCELHFLLSSKDYYYYLLSSHGEILLYLMMMITLSRDCNDEGSLDSPTKDDERE
jgi:hypothetical protein